MNTKNVLIGILRDNDELLIVKRSETDDLYSGAWKFPGGHLEKGETLKEGLKGELFEPIITHYYDEAKNKNDELIHDLEIDFIVNVILSDEHCDYGWGKIDSELLDDYIKINYQIYKVNNFCERIKKVCIRTKNGPYLT